ncbi:hypothetical protein F5Y07DRAFT_327549 [Xylaria sp. FL0933]|nr:hypothetical protein F5Y07DRAFT_327549 [Xylaria sp. FL0933]
MVTQNRLLPPREGSPTNMVSRQKRECRDLPNAVPGPHASHPWPLVIIDSSVRVLGLRTLLISSKSSNLNYVFNSHPSAGKGDGTESLSGLRRSNVSTRECHLDIRITNKKRGIAERRRQHPRSVFFAPPMLMAEIRFYYASSFLQGTLVDLPTCYRTFVLRSSASAARSRGSPAAIQLAVQLQNARRANRCHFAPKSMCVEHYVSVQQRLVLMLSNCLFRAPSMCLEWRCC